jgi:hypothetical protein
MLAFVAKASIFHKEKRKTKREGGQVAIHGMVLVGGEGWSHFRRQQKRLGLLEYICNLPAKELSVLGFYLIPTTSTTSLMGYWRGAL